MSPRNTNTGGVLEQMVLPSLERGGYTVETQVRIGERPGGGRHVADVVASHGDSRYLISLKWQQTGGTAEQKVPFEIMCLSKAVAEDGWTAAYLVLGGGGWSLKQFYLGGGLSDFLKEEVAQAVRIVDLDTFVALANNTDL